MKSLTHKLLLSRNLFSQVAVASNVKREAVDEGVRLGHSDAQIIGEAIEEVPKRLASTIKRLATR